MRRVQVAHDLHLVVLLDERNQLWPHKAVEVVGVNQRPLARRTVHLHFGRQAVHKRCDCKSDLSVRVQAERQQLVEQQDALLLGHESLLDQVVEHPDVFQDNHVLGVLQQLLGERQHPLLDFLEADVQTHASERLDDLHPDLEVLDVVDAAQTLLRQEVALLDAEDLAQLDQALQHRNHGVAVVVAAADRLNKDLDLFPDRLELGVVVRNAGVLLHDVVRNFANLQVFSS